MQKHIIDAQSDYNCKQISYGTGEYENIHNWGGFDVFHNLENMVCF